jgi:tetratricopeptide (TPR) repeat protein
MEIKPQMSQGPIVRPDEQVEIEPQEKKSVEQESSASAGNARSVSNTDGMRQAGTEMKGSMKTTGNFLQQQLIGQLETRVSQNEGRSTQLLGWPNSQGASAIPLFGSQVTSAQAQSAPTTSSTGGSNATTQANTMAEASKNFEKGQAAFQAGRYQEALDAFNKADQLFPHADFKYNQAACLEKLGKPELAAIKYEAYLAGKPDAPDAAKVQTHITKLHDDAMKAAQSAFDRGEAAFKAGRYKEAAGAFAEAYEQKPLPNFLYNRAAAYDMAGDKKEAVKNYQLYLTMHPTADDADRVGNRMHKLLKSTGDELMQPDPNKAAQAAAERGRVAYEAGNFREAAAAFTAAYEQEPHPDLLYNIGASYQRAGDTKNAVKNYQLYLNNHPDAKDADKVRNAINKLLAKTGDGLIDPSLEAAQAAFDRGEVAYRAGNFKEAASAFEEAYKEKPMPDFLYNIGAAYQMAGDTKNAVKNYQLYLNNHPDAKDADKVRNAINKLLQKTGDDLIQP